MKSNDISKFRRTAVKVTAYLKPYAYVHTCKTMSVHSMANERLDSEKNKPHDNSRRGKEQNVQKYDKFKYLTSNSKCFEIASKDF